MKKILYVEHFVNEWTTLFLEELSKNNYELTVFSLIKHKSRDNIVFIDTISILNKNFDLVIINGTGDGTQNITQLFDPKNTTLYLLNTVSTTELHANCIFRAKYLGYSTEEQYKHLVEVDKSFKNKSIQINKAIIIPEKKNNFFNFFRKKYSIQTKYLIVLSGTSFWKNKKSFEIIHTFTKVNRDDITLVVLGNHSQTEKEPYKNVLNIENTECLNAIDACDLYISINDTLVLEVMARKKPWVYYQSKFGLYGYNYQNLNELQYYIFTKIENYLKPLPSAYKYILENHSFEKMVKTISKLIA